MKNPSFLFLLSKDNHEMGVWGKYMFQLTKEEFENLKCQNGTSSWGGDRRSLPHAFTEQGVSMLSSIHNRLAVNFNLT